MATATKRRTIAERIAHLRPCGGATEWAKGYTSPKKAWTECQRGDWMLWLIGRTASPPESESRKQLVLCACECARLSLPIFEKRYPNDGRVRKCIETAERWATGEANITELREARAYAAAAAAAAAARAETLAKCSDIVRKHYPNPPRVSDEAAV